MASRFCLPFLALLLAGCSTPTRRIEQNPELFSRLSPDQQLRARQGEVALGDSRDLVFLALGRPDRSYSRSTPQGDVEVWAYTQTEVRTRPQMVRGTYHYRDAEGRLRTAHDNIWVQVEDHEVFERMRVEFTGDTVTAIDRIRR